MYKRKENTEEIIPVLWTTKELQDFTRCGRPGAVRIGTNAHARVQIGKTVRWIPDKVKAYLLQAAE